MALQPTGSSASTSTTLRLISLLVNKFANPKTVQTTLQNAGIDIDSLLNSSASPQTIRVAFAVAKGLLIQGKSGALTTRYLEALLQLPSTSTKPIARHFTTLLAPDDILTKENHCLISGLYKQKLFGQAVPELTSALRTADAAKKANYLIALSGILRWLPYSIIQPSLPSLVPALLQTLDLTDAADVEVKASALMVFESVLMHNPDAVAEHTASFITRLLASTSAAKDGGNTAEVRAKALQCLALVPRQLKREAVVPYRRQVVKRLLACLDDRKRNVRAEAVRCRTAWLALDEGNDDEE
jgi:DNA repair/transcription protein MET18/MMS19